MPPAFDYVMPLMGRGLDYQDTATLLTHYDDTYTHPKDCAQD